MFYYIYNSIIYIILYVILIYVIIYICNSLFITYNAFFLSLSSLDKNTINSARGLKVECTNDNTMLRA